MVVALVQNRQCAEAVAVDQFAGPPQMVIGMYRDRVVTHQIGDRQIVVQLVAGGREIVNDLTQQVSAGHDGDSA